MKNWRIFVDFRTSTFQSWSLHFSDQFSKIRTWRDETFVKYAVGPHEIRILLKLYTRPARICHFSDCLEELFGTLDRILYLYSIYLAKYISWKCNFGFYHWILMFLVINSSESYHWGWDDFWHSQTIFSQLMFLLK